MTSPPSLCDLLGDHQLVVHCHYFDRLVACVLELRRLSQVVCCGGFQHLHRERNVIFSVGVCVAQICHVPLDDVTSQTLGVYVGGIGFATDLVESDLLRCILLQGTQQPVSGFSDTLPPDNSRSCTRVTQHALLHDHVEILVNGRDAYGLCWRLHRVDSSASADDNARVAQVLDHPLL